MASVTGRCKCAAVSLEAKSASQVVNCHCGLCRSINGSAFSTYAVVSFGDLKVAGSQAVASHQVTERARKHFCSICGTPLYNTNTKYAGVAMLHVGILDEHATQIPVINVYCGDKLIWVDIPASTKNFEASSLT
jgi:hypothetical protein